MQRFLSKSQCFVSEIRCITLTTLAFIMRYPGQDLERSRLGATVWTLDPLYKKQKNQR